MLLFLNLKAKGCSLCDKSLTYIQRTLEPKTRTRHRCSGNVPAKLIRVLLSIKAYALLLSSAALRSRSSSREACSARLSSGSLSSLGAGSGVFLLLGEWCSTLDLSSASRKRSSCATVLTCFGL